jgi:hypothetical protein
VWSEFVGFRILVRTTVGSLCLQQWTLGFSYTWDICWYSDWPLAFQAGSTVWNFFFSGSATQRGLWPPRSRGFVITHNDAPQSVGLLWTSDQLVAETFTWQHTQQTNIHARGGIRTHDRSRRAAVDLRLRPRGHWDRLLYGTSYLKCLETANYKRYCLYGCARLLPLTGSLTLFSNFFERGVHLVNRQLICYLLAINSFASC